MLVTTRHGFYLHTLHQVLENYDPLADQLFWKIKVLWEQASSIRLYIVFHLPSHYRTRKLQQRWYYTGSVNVYYLALYRKSFSIKHVLVTTVL